MKTSICYTQLVLARLLAGRTIHSSEIPQSLPNIINRINNKHGVKCYQASNNLYIMHQHDIDKIKKSIGEIADDE